jgi:hypothetical protein
MQELFSGILCNIFNCCPNCPVWSRVWSYPFMSCVISSNEWTSRCSVQHDILWQSISWSCFIHVFCYVAVILQFFPLSACYLFCCSLSSSKSLIPKQCSMKPYELSRFFLDFFMITSLKLWKLFCLEGVLYCTLNASLIHILGTLKGTLVMVSHWYEWIVQHYLFLYWEFSLFMSFLYLRCFVLICGSLSICHG